MTLYREIILSGRIFRIVITDGILNMLFQIEKQRSIYQNEVKEESKVDLSGSRSSGDWQGIHGEIQQSYQQLQRQLSQEFQQ